MQSIINKVYVSQKKSLPNRFFLYKCVAKQEAVKLMHIMKVIDHMTQLKQSLLNKMFFSNSH